MDDEEQAGTHKMKVRLALREEGNFWNAYMAQMGTMDNAKLIGSIVLGAAMKDPKIKQDFMNLMMRVMGLAIKEVSGSEPEKWETTTAPESERSGNA